MDYFLESCCTSVEEVLEAERRGARRIELCVNLAAGGTTPPPELVIAVLKATTLPVNVLIRPRPGDFVYTAAEVAEMVRSVEFCRSVDVNGEANAGVGGRVNGVVIGALTPAGDIDVAGVRKLLEAAGALQTTFHRAFDCCRDAFSALDTIAALGFDRLLTSGHESDAWTGRFTLAELVNRTSEVESSGKRIFGKPALIVMPGCGVRESNIAELERITCAREFHASKSFWK